MKVKAFWGISSRKGVTKWYVFISYAYPYATKMDAVVTRMLTFCVSVCYKNGCSGYTDVNIFAYPYAAKNGCSGYTDVNILRIRMLQKWMQWLHGS